MKQWILLGLVTVALAACEKEQKECPSSSQKTFALTGFTRINAAETFRISVKKGNEFSIIARGCVNDLNDLVMQLMPGKTLDISYGVYNRKRNLMDIDISLPVLSDIILGGAAKGKVSGFDGQNSNIGNILSGIAECTMTGTGLNAHFNLADRSVLHITGNTESLYGVIEGNARLNAYDVAATEVDISASGTAKAFVQPQQFFFAEATGESRIYYRGNPPVKNFSTGGNGKILHE